LWDGQMTAAERQSLRRLASHQPSVADTTQSLAEQSVTWAEEHLFERRSVVHEHELWRHALEHARGREVNTTDIQAVTQRRDYLRDRNRPGKVTTREHLQREADIVQISKEGVCDCHPLVWQPRPLNPQLDDEQRQALHSLLVNTSRVSVFRGG